MSDKTVIAEADALRASTSPASLGWLAGIVDGEGSITLPRGKTRSGYIYYSIRVSIPNTDARIMSKIQELTLHRLGKVYPHKRPSRSRPIYCWITSARRALCFLYLIIPFLVAKKEQAELAVEMQRLLMRQKSIKQRDRTTGRIIRGEVRTDTAQRDRLVQAVKTLNKRGVCIT